MNYSFGKNICEEIVNSGGAAGEWLITDEFSTDLDEMGIFVLSKDQTFRICATFLDPVKFSILVIHLVVELFSYYDAISSPTQFFVIWILALLSHGTLRKPRFLMFESKLWKTGWTKKVGNLLENISISCFHFWREFKFFGTSFEKLFYKKIWL
jgi:hypothetical protein